ncbi:unnamed protein product [Brassica rapa]|uniref:Uncharacterized protein n=1 Tax=Brassica campestris TaxID=3711 RepID=A0A8D9M0W1_BRACM|nr:unnamed protein product [Brassica rapa]
MGLLDHLWDDTVAGPLPENGLGKLRKHHTFSFRPSSANDQSEVRSYGGDSPEEAVKVTRSIMIIKPPGYQSGSAPVSPASSTTPVSPTNTGGKKPFRFRRRSASDVFDKAAGSENGPRNSPPTYGV